MIDLTDKNLVYYGPHPCQICDKAGLHGTMIVKAGNGAPDDLEFDYPLAQTQEAGLTHYIYPNMQGANAFPWVQHVHVNHAKPKNLHHVVKGDHCYYCTKCNEAHGDADGFVGEVCAGKSMGQFGEPKQDTQTDLLFRPKPIPINCQHQFVLITQVEKASSTVSQVSLSRLDRIGAKCGCILCGEIRTVWDNGELETNPIKHVHGTKPDHNSTSGSPSVSRPSTTGGHTPAD